VSGNVSHAHDWVPLDHEKVDKAEYDLGHRTATGGYAVRVVAPEIHYYIVRACRRCPEVWWQEYDPQTARERVSA
jgi:hypothetical protein